MRRRLILLGLILAAAAVGLALVLPVARDDPPWLEEVDESDYDRLVELAGRTSAAQARQVLATIDPGGRLAAYLEIGATEARVFADHGRTGTTVVPLALEPVTPVRPATLTGLRILLDPGHFGGAWSEIESRHIVQGGEPVREGDLTWAVARLLTADLEAAGAEVTLTRGQPPDQPFPHDLHPAFDRDREAAMVLAERLMQQPYADYRRSYPALYGDLMLRRARREIGEEIGDFGLYNRFDLRRRAAMAADADVTLSIHFNTTGPRRHNWVMTFVPGNLLAGEADTRSQRFWSLRRVLEGQWLATVDLARSIGAAMKEHLDLPSLDPARLALATRPTKVVVDGEQGVFARNLAMVRRTPGPVVLVEGPCVDTDDEYQRLQDRSVTIDGRAYPRRVRQYADAVYAGLERWLQPRTDRR
jgi:N-acetylmuramoyl-L-alanine amidase